MVGNLDAQVVHSRFGVTDPKVFMALASSAVGVELRGKDCYTKRLESRARAPHPLTPAGISVVSPPISAARCIVASFASSVLYQSLWFRALDDAVASGFTLLLCQLCRRVLEVQARRPPLVCGSMVPYLAWL